MERTINRYGFISFVCFLLFSVFIIFIYQKFRTDLDGTYYRYYPETQIIEKNEYVVFENDNFKWYDNGKKKKILNIHIAIILSEWVFSR